jgi:hypothetical protein
MILQNGGGVRISSGLLVITSLQLVIIFIKLSHHILSSADNSQKSVRDIAVVVIL